MNSSTKADNDTIIVQKQIAHQLPEHAVTRLPGRLMTACEQYSSANVLGV